MKVPPVSEKILKVTLSDLNSYSFGNSCLNNSQCYEKKNLYLLNNFGNWNRICNHRQNTVRNIARKILQTPCSILAPEMVVESRQAWNSAKWECQFGNRARKFGVTAAKMHFEHPTIWQKICSTNLDGIFALFIF